MMKHSKGLRQCGWLYGQRGSFQDFFTISNSLLEHSFIVVSYGWGGVVWVVVEWVRWGGLVAHGILVTATVPWFWGGKACQ